MGGCEVETTYKFPEAGKSVFAGEDTTEDQAKHEQQVGNVGTTLSCFEPSDDHGRKDSEQVEDGKHLVLETLDSVGSLEEDETDEESDERAKSGLGVDVNRSTPVLLEHAVEDLLELNHKGSGEFAVAAIIDVGVFDALLLSLDTLEFGLDLLAFGAVAPGLEPIEFGVRSRSSANDFQHPFGRVGLRGTCMATHAFKVAGHDVGVLADITKVHCLTTLGQEEKSVEALEQHGRGLMNCAKNGLAGVCQLLEKIQNSPRGLRVETRGRLINEQQQRRLGSKFDTDSKTLTLLDVETFTRNTNDSVGIFFHIEQLDDLLDIIELLLLGDVSGLAEEGTEVEGFSDGGSLEMQILLLDVTGLALEGHVSRFTVNQHLACDDTHRNILPLENRGLFLKHTTGLLGSTSSAAGSLSSNHRTNVSHGSLGVAVLLLSIGNGGRLVTTSVDQNFTLGLLLRNKFGGSHVGNSEEDDPSDNNTKVAPSVLPLVAELHLSVAVTIDSRSSRNVGVSGDSRVGDELVALVISVVELVDNNSLESIGNRVNVVKPLAPSEHVTLGNDETSKDDEIQNEDSGGDKSLEETARSGGDGTEDHGHDQNNNKGHQDEKEESSWFSFQVIEDGTDNKSHDKVTNKRTNCDSRVTLESQPSTPQAKLNLLHVGEGERRLKTLTLGLLGLLRGTESLGVRAVDGVSNLVVLNLDLKSSILGAVLPGGRKLIGGAGNLALESISHDSLVGSGHGGEEIRSGLASRALETQVDEVLLGSISAAKEDLSTLVDDGRLVEQVVGALRRLVDGHNGGVVEKFGLQTEGFAKFDGVGRVETSSRVVPALQRSSRQGSLGNGNTLALTTRDTTNVLVTDAGVGGVRNTKHGHDDIAKVVGKVVPVQALGKLTRLSSACGENTVELTGDGLEGGRATSTRGSKNDKHLTSVDNTVKVAQNIDALLTSASDSADNILET
ncbi:hypothetical protein HG531_005583 [Fusarium graminearum]|nr:hypothetical protein HG531_005583 [Fusarium graminearum]